METSIRDNKKMKRTKFLAIAAMALAMTGFATAAPRDGGTVALTEVRNYFHNNDAPLPSSPLITTQQAFDTHFSPAAYMGEGGEPTRLNFRRQAVVAIVLPVTDLETDIDSVSLAETGKRQLTLRYIVRRGARRSFSTQPVRLFTVPRKYADWTVSVEADDRREVSLEASTVTTCSYNAPARGISLLVDVPTEGPRPLTDSVTAWVRSALNGYVRACSADSAGAVDVITSDDPQQMVADCGVLVYGQMKLWNAPFAPEWRCQALLTLMRTDETTASVTYEADAYSYMGGAHGLGSHTGATFDKKTGRRVQLVRDAEGLRKLITDRLHKTCDGIMLNEEPVPLPQQSPFMRGGKIVFAYQPYEIGPYAIGMPECAFYPYEIADYVVKSDVTERGL